MKKFITIGSCLSYIIGNNYMRLDDASCISSTRHNRIDKIVDTYLKKNQQELSYSYLSDFHFEQDSTFDLTQKIDNQFSDRSLGKTNIDPDIAVGLVDLIDKDYNIDLIVYDTYCDILFKLLRAKKEFNRTFFFNVKYSNNWDAFFDLDSETLAISSIVNCYVNFVEFFKAKNPNIKILFINFPFLHHKKDYVVSRLRELNNQFIQNEFLNKNSYFVPAAKIPFKYMIKGDPTHFKQDEYNNLYCDYASMITSIMKNDFSHEEWYSLNQQATKITWNKLKNMFTTNESDRVQKSAQELALSYFNRGNLLENEDKINEAISIYKKAIEIDPNSSIELYKKLDSLLDQQNDRDELIKIYQRAIQYNPDNYWFHKRLGDILQVQGLLEEAISSYQKSIAKNSSFSWSYKKLGEALEQKGNRYLKDANTNYQKALKLAPKSMGDVPKKLKNLSRALGEVDEDPFRPSDPKSYWKKRKDDVLYQMVKTLAHGYASEGVSVLDVGCHTSSFISELDWFEQKTVADLPYLADHWKNVKGVKFVSGDFLKSEFDTAFDLVLCTQVVEHLEKPKAFIQKLLSVGKTIIVSTTYEVPKGACKYHVQDPISLEKFQSWFDTELTATAIVRQPNNKVWRNIIGVVTKEQ